MTTKWCECCDEIEATTVKNGRGIFTLCVNCYARFYYWQKRGPGALMERRRNLKLYLKTNSILLGEIDVEDIDDAREKKASAA